MTGSSVSSSNSYPAHSRSNWRSVPISPSIAWLPTCTLDSSICWRVPTGTSGVRLPQRSPVSVRIPPSSIPTSGNLLQSQSEQWKFPTGEVGSRIGDTSHIARRHPVRHPVHHPVQHVSLLTPSPRPSMLVMMNKTGWSEHLSGDP